MLRDRGTKLGDVANLLPSPPPEPAPYADHGSSSDHGERLKVFLAHASEDKPRVREVYRSLMDLGYRPWLDEEDILPGQEWRDAIKGAVEESHVALVFLSSISVNKTGEFQREIRQALDVAATQPEGQIFVVPVLLSEVEVPGRLKDYQWVRLDSRRELRKLDQTLSARARFLGLEEA